MDPLVDLQRLGPDRRPVTALLHHDVLRVRCRLARLRPGEGDLPGPSLGFWPPVRPRARATSRPSRVRSDIQGVLELVWLVAFAALLLALSQAPASRWNAATWDASTWLGTVSYSLYAVHFPVALLVWAGVAHLDLPGPAIAPVMVLAGLIAALGSAFACYRLVEAPSLTRARTVTAPGRPTA